MHSRTSGDPLSAAVASNRLVPLESVLCTDELSRRPSRPPDYDAENRMLGMLAQALADSPGTILQTIAGATLEMLRADSAGFSMLTEDGSRFYWPAIAGRWKNHIGVETPRDLGPQGDVLDRDAPLVFAHPERRYSYLAHFSPTMAECLLVPLHAKGRSLGVIWAATHDEPRNPDRHKFDAEDLRQLVSIGAYAAAAQQTMVLSERLKHGDADSKQSQTERARRATGPPQAHAASAPRRAALNLLEDAVQARQVLETVNADLRENEERLAIELAATQRLQSVASPLIEGGEAAVLYQKLVDAAVAIMQSDMGSMQMVDEGQDALRLLAWRGFDREFGQVFELDRSDAKTSCSAARRAGQRVIVPDVETWDVLVGTPELEDHRKTGIRAVQSTPLFSRAGRLVGMISTHWRTPHTPTESELRPLDILARQAADLIERTRAEEATARLAAIVSSSHDAIIGKDLDGVITSWNKGAERLFGYVANEVIGKPGALLIPPDRMDEEPSILGRIRRGERVDQFETVRRRKDGSLMDLSITVSPIEDARGRIIGAAKIARDITARKKSEEALVEADRYKNEFLAMLAHELRGPLAPVRNGLQIVRMHSGNAEAVATAATMMERQIGQMARIIDDLIDVSRISLGKLELRKEPIELTSAMRSVAEATLSLFESMHHELTLTLPLQPIYVNADPTRLAQVVGNLLTNACKFTDKGGRIGLTVEREDGQAVIRVCDTGIGIAADNLHRIFDMFSQVDSSLERSRGGLGIGLSLAKKVVEMHGGVVTVGSAGLGQGSEFVVRMPMVVELNELPAPEPEVKQATNKRRVLVVDDNQDSVNSLALLLELSGHEVCTAHDGLEAVEAAATFRPEVVLLDLGLPKLNGYEAALRIRKLPGGESMKLVALSGWAQEEDRHRSEQVGFDVHLVKPVDPRILNHILATIGA